MQGAVPSHSSRQQDRQLWLLAVRTHNTYLSATGRKTCLQRDSGERRVGRGALSGLCCVMQLGHGTKIKTEEWTEEMDAETRGEKTRSNRGKKIQRYRKYTGEKNNDWRAAACKDRWDVMRAWSKGSVRCSQTLTIWQSIPSSLICTYDDNDIVACSFIQLPTLYLWLHFHVRWPEPFHVNGFKKNDKIAFIKVVAEVWKLATWLHRRCPQVTLCKSKSSVKSLMVVVRLLSSATCHSVCLEQYLAISK